MAFSATGLAKEDVVSKSDPFLAAWKRRPAGGEADWVPVFKTEVGQEGTGCACRLCMLVMCFPGVVKGVLVLML
jgi:hypothetical protein